MRLELVRDWMSRDVITITPDASLSEIDRTMVENTIRRLPVVDNGRLVGIVTYGDVRGAKPPPTASLTLWEINYLISRLTAADIMTSDPITVSENATIGEAAYLMMHNMISGLPVLNNQGALVGIITESDIFRMVVRDWVRRSQQSSPEPYTQYG